MRKDNYEQTQATEKRTHEESENTVTHRLLKNRTQLKDMFSCN